MKVRTRLVVTFGALTALLVLPALFAASRLGDLAELAVEGRRDHAEVALLLGRMSEASSELEDLQRNLVIDASAAFAGGATPNPAFPRAVRSARDSLRVQLEALRASSYGSAAGTLDSTTAGILVRSRRIDSLVAPPGPTPARLQAARDTTDALQPLFARLDSGLVAVADSVDAVAGRDFDAARAISAAARTATLLALFGVLALALLLAWWTTVVLTRPLGDLVEATDRVTGGKLEPPPGLPYERDDEIGDLSRAFREMTHRLTELDRLKAEFMGVASHELKTPINVIRGYTELIEENIAGEVTEHQAEILGAIAEQTRVMSRLVSRLMDISRLETGTYRMEIEKVHTEDVITGVLRSFDILAAEKDIQLTAETDPSTPEVIEVDVDLVRDEVLGNLVSNALKHTPAGGRVCIDVRGEGPWVVFEVSDTGPGVPVEDREHIFEKYYQVQRSRKVGTGLGLAVAREMVEAHGGRIEMVSGPAPGATFRVRLPVVRGDVREPQISGSPPPSAAPAGAKGGG